MPDQGAPATVHGRTLADDLGPDRGRSKEICLRLDGRSAGPLRQVQGCSAGAQGVSESHDGPTMQDGRLGTEILPDEQLGSETLRGGTEEVDAKQFCERSLDLLDDGELIHTSPPERIGKTNGIFAPPPRQSTPSTTRRRIRPAHGSSRASRAAQQLRRSAQSPGLGRPSVATRGLDRRRRMGEGRTARGDASGAARGTFGGGTSQSRAAPRSALLRAAPAGGGGALGARQAPRARGGHQRRRAAGVAAQAFILLIHLDRSHNPAMLGSYVVIH